MSFISNLAIRTFIPLPTSGLATAISPPSIINFLIIIFFCGAVAASSFADSSLAAGLTFLSASVYFFTFF
jgi:hypothetical protein